MARGGYRQPANPAPVSGPGHLARRTDGGPGQPVRRLPNAGYGESAEFQDLQRSAPLASSAGRGGVGGQPTLDTSGIVPLTAPSGRPDEPVTAGASAGAGPGPEAITANAAAEDLMKLHSYLPAFRYFASLPGATNGFRRFVRQLEGTTV